MAAPIGKTYLSTAVTENGSPKELVPNTRIRLEFARVPNQNEEGPEVYDVLRAYAGCNKLGAHSEAGTLLADGKLWIIGFGSTAKGSEPARRDQDEWLKTFLMSKPTWQVYGDELTLTSADTTITLLDRKIAEPDSRSTLSVGRSSPRSPTATSSTTTTRPPRRGSPSMAIG